MIRKSFLMRQVEAKWHMPLDELLVRTFNETGGFIEAAEKLEVKKGTLCYWLLHEGIRLETTALRRDEVITIKRKAQP